MPGFRHVGACRMPAARFCISKRTAGFILPELIMHIFLTGEIQVGKTTVIRNFLTKTGLPADGFMTYWKEDSGGRSLYLSGYGFEHQTCNEFLVYCGGHGRKPLISADLTDIFNTKGVHLLKNSGKKSVIVMDELGFLESKALSFQKAVFEHISGDVPVLGVVKPAKTEFLDAVRSFPGVEVYVITLGNRENVLSNLLKNYAGREMR